MQRELRQALSETLRQLREKLPHKPSQEILAGSVGMERSYWGYLERGERSLTLFNLFRIALALGVSPSRLVLAIDRSYRRISGAETTRTPIKDALKHLCEWMDESPEMKWLGSPHQKTVHCNRPMLRYLGVAHLEGETWRELVHPDDAEKYFAKHTAAIAKHEAHLSRYRMRGGDRQYRWFVEHAVPQYTQKGIFLGFLGTMIQEPEDPLP